MKYWLFNAEQADGLQCDAADIWFENGMGFSGNDRKKYGEPLGKLKVGETVLMYQNQKGIVGIGTVAEPWDGKGYKQKQVYVTETFPEYRIRIDWEHDLRETPFELGWTASQFLCAVQKPELVARIEDRIRLAKMGYDTIPAVRVLPMSAKEFPGHSTEDVQFQFFLSELPRRESGAYEYRSAGMQAEPGTVVLFQFKKQVIASAVLKGRNQFEKPNGLYHGALLFDVFSIRVFDAVDSAQMKAVWPDEFTKFNNNKSVLSAGGYPEFERRLNNVRAPVFGLDDLSQRVDDAVKEASHHSAEERLVRLAQASPKPRKVAVTTYVYDRNPDVIVEVLARAKGICERCKRSAPFVRKSNGEPYLEVHHEIRLADGGHDTVENAVALCPNCHRQVHYG